MVAYWCKSVAPGWSHSSAPTFPDTLRLNKLTRPRDRGASPQVSRAIAKCHRAEQICSLHAGRGSSQLWETDPAETNFFTLSEGSSAGPLEMMQNPPQKIKWYNFETTSLRPVKFHVWLHVLIGGLGKRKWSPFSLALQGPIPPFFPPSSRGVSWTSTTTSKSAGVPFQNKLSALEECKLSLSRWSRSLPSFRTLSQQAASQWQQAMAVFSQMERDAPDTTSCATANLRLGNAQNVPSYAVRE